MSKNGKWGGEPELLVLSQFVLQRPLEAETSALRQVGQLWDVCRLCSLCFEVYVVEGSGLRHLLTYCEDGRECEPSCLFFACRTALRCQECPKHPVRVLFHSYGHYETLLPES